MHTCMKNGGKCYRQIQNHMSRWQERERETDRQIVRVSDGLTCATRSDCSRWNMRLRASHASPAISALTFIPHINGPMVSKAAMERTHNCRGRFTQTAKSGKCRNYSTFYIWSPEFSGPKVIGQN